MTNDDLTTRTVAELRHIAMGDGSVKDDPYAAVDELALRAEASAALRGAAQDVLDARAALTKARGGTIAESHESLEVKGLALMVFEAEQSLRAALAAAPQPAAAPVAPDREAAIEAWRKRFDALEDGEGTDPEVDAVVDEAVALMRSAPQPPAPVPSDPVRDARDEAARMQADGSLKTCSAQLQTDLWPNYCCTRLAGHSGDHVAFGVVSDPPLAQWPNAPVQPEAQPHHKQRVQGDVAGESPNRQPLAASKAAGDSASTTAMPKATSAILGAPSSSAAPRADDGVDEAIESLGQLLCKPIAATEHGDTVTTECDFDNALLTVLRRLAAAARRGGAS